MKLLNSLTAISLLFWSGCSVLIGHVKPEEVKSIDSKIIDVSQIDPSWKKISIGPTSGPSEDIPDGAWQSTKTASVISINSACRQGSDEDNDLKSVTQTLLSQWNNLKILNERELTVSNYPALETTAEGYYLSRNRKFQTVAVKSPMCVYDLIYLSPVKTFDQELSVFQKFRDNLILK